MKKSVLILLFIGTHVGFFIIHIRNQIEIIKASFNKQKNQQFLTQLKQKKESLIAELNALQNKPAIKTFARNQLHLQPISLNQIHSEHIQ